MSWIFGVVMKHGVPDLKIQPGMHDDSADRISYGNVSILFEAGKNTFSEFNKDTQSGWLVSGVGLDSSSGVLFGLSEWAKTLSTSGIRYKFPEGHYIILNLENESISISTDKSGLRDIYLTENSEAIYFSTRIDFLSDVVDLEIDYSVFGSRWLLFNQLSHLSPIKPLKRLVAGKSAILNIKNCQVEYFEKKWNLEASGEPLKFDDYYARLGNLINLTTNRTINLGLSGGMDSRVILSYLLKNRTGWQTHTFGNPNHPDAEIASELCKRFSFPNDLIEHKEYNIDDLIKKIRDYSTSTIVNNSASIILQYDAYNELKNQDSVIIDGGFGEIWRREFFNRLYFSGEALLKESKFEQIATNLKIPRVDIFNHKIDELMFAGCVDDLRILKDFLPNPEKVSFGNWLDLFALHTRLANYYGPEQTRLDGIITAYMPFVQSSLIGDLLNTPIKLRKNAYLYRKIIQKNEPRLTRIKLAKGTHFYPFGFSMLQNRLYSKVRSVLKLKSYSDNSQEAFLDLLKDYVMDQINSASVKTYANYDYGKISAIAEDYYKGNKHRAAELDWWLSFDEFRRGIQR